MEQISGGQLKLIKTLMRKLNVADGDAMVLGFTDMRTGHVSEMTVVEATALIKHLKGMDPDEVACDRMRKKLFATAYEYHGLSRGASVEERKRVQEQLKGWVLKFGFKKCELDKYNKADLATLVGVFNKVYKQYLKAL